MKNTRFIGTIFCIIIGVGSIKNSKANYYVKNASCLKTCPYSIIEKGNIIVDHDFFILSQNKKTKFADWVAYKVVPKNISVDVKTSRYWKKDPKIPQEYVLIPSDYKGAYKKCNYDRGHQAPLASFKGADWKKTNYTSNLTPQKSDLNRGSWLKLENKVRSWVKKENKPLYVITGTYYDNEDVLCGLETTRIEYQIPSGYWKIIVIEEEDKLKVASFMFPQDAQKRDDYCKFESNLKKIKDISKLEFFDNTKAEYPLDGISCN